MDIEEKLKQIKSRFEEVNAAMSDPSVFDDPDKYTELTKERSDLEELVQDYDSWKDLHDRQEGNKELIEMDEDAEITEMAKDENKEIKEQLAKLEDDIKMKLVPKDPEDSKNAIIEVRAGTGGDEAAIFAGDLFDMYRRYADSQNWKMSLMSITESDKGGYKEIVFSLEGNEVFGKMKYESGVHRVQRVPATESQGRVHTSAATVAVLPEVEEVDVDINTADLRIDTFRASGAGGQHVNKTDSAIRITHEPTGIVVECQEERSQHQNKEKAMTMLRSKMYDIELEKKEKARAAERKSQVSTGDRSAKIRTYNFPQGRFTDHRINLTLYNLDNIMKGDLHEAIDALRVQDNLDKLNELVED
ncbi:MAG: peptide chain release factor 1 [Balneola sp.]|jgi:peptide chain release factor 1|nr:peptide chain release factor 1 [Balneola sp. EhC07]MBO6620573.1 peptide chain release factor 1 [Balneola sp.]MBO6650967.1 peptide chain release factor 1 [Balneola sp.]MBO6711128.1 peptide chain release factor 1 [Balneola sp.]MBO6800758.1 peptide chain release factor 1 [Balneola sp.]MBO6869063.1 peptide chain release factor 1 [Balneola sp.]